MFPVGELLDSSLQGVLGVPFQITLNISGETLSQHLGTMLQVFLQPPVQHEHLVIRSAERHQGDANNQRDDESSAEQSHDASSETHNSAGGPTPRETPGTRDPALRFRLLARTKAFRNSLAPS